MDEAKTIYRKKPLVKSFGLRLGQMIARSVLTCGELAAAEWSQAIGGSQLQGLFKSVSIKELI